MGRGSLLWAAALLVAGLCAPVHAGDVATQTVTFRIDPIDEIAVDGDPGRLVVKSAVAGRAPEPVEDASTALSITTNGSLKKVTAALDRDLPTDVSLAVEIAGLGGGNRFLSTQGVDVATGLSRLVRAECPLTYTLYAGVGASPFAQDERVVTYTITDGT